jgi:hypothetical protein
LGRATLSVSTRAAAHRKLGNDKIGRAADSLCNLDTALTDFQESLIEHQRAYDNEITAENSKRIPVLSRWNNKIRVYTANARRDVSRLTDEGVATVRERLTENGMGPGRVHSLISWVKRPHQQQDDVDGLLNWVQEQPDDMERAGSGESRAAQIQRMFDPLDLWGFLGGQSTSSQSASPGQQGHRRVGPVRRWPPNGPDTVGF